MRTSLFLALIKLVNILLFVFITPYFVKALGLDGYGDWTLVYSAVTLIIALDFGFANWIRNRIQIDNITLRESILCLLKMNIPFLLLVSLVAVIFFYTTDFDFYSLCLLIISLLLVVNINSLKLLCFSKGKHVIPELFFVIPRVLFYLTSVLYSINDIAGLLMLWNLWQVISIILLICFIARFEYEKIKYKVEPKIVAILKHSKWMFGLQVLSALLYSSDRFIISGVMNGTALAYYDILLKPFQGVYMLFVAASTPIWHKVAAKGQTENVFTFINNKSILYFIAMFLVMYSACALSSPIVSSYLSNNEISSSHYEALIVCFIMLLSSIVVVLSLVLNGLDVIRFQLKVYLIASSIKLTLIYFTYLYFEFSILTLLYISCFSCLFVILSFFSYLRRIG